MGPIPIRWYATTQNPRPFFPQNPPAVPSSGPRPRGAAPAIGDTILLRLTAESADGRPPGPCRSQTIVSEQHRNILRQGSAIQPSAGRPEMSMSGSGGKRAGTTPTAAEPSPKRRRSRRLPPLPLPSPRNNGSTSSPSFALTSPPYAPTSPPYDYSPPPSPYRSPSPSPCRSWSQRQPSYDDDADYQSRSRSRGSEDTDGHGRSVWRPHSCRELGEGRRNGTFDVRISDYDRLFTCRSCHRMLSSPVYQCAAGHVTCWKCHGDVGDNRCSFCGSIDGYGRNRAVEEFLHRISFPCRNREYGCEAFLTQHMMQAHERSCHHEPCFCPVQCCSFAGTTGRLEAHLTGRHPWRRVKFRYGENFEVPLYNPAILCSEDDGELFHINGTEEGHGTALFMICIRPDSARKQEFTYKLKMSTCSEGGRHRLQMESTVWNTSLRHGIGEGHRVFLVVPDELWVPEGIVEVCIRKVAAGATSD